jgi:membrane protein YqaA with SNARE-associated domain
MSADLVTFVPGGPYVWCYVFGLISAVVPCFNAELILVSLCALSQSKVSLLAVAILATAGQMSGKCTMYWLGRRSLGLTSARHAEALARWRARLERSPRSVLAVVFVSSLVGVPPFYVTSVLAGALKVGFAEFTAIGTCGRFLRFASVAFFPQLVLDVVQRS